MAKRSAEGVRNWIRNDYKRKAKRRGIEWDLSKELFNHLTHQNCTYCGIPPTQTHGGQPYNGVDRKDNSVGYTEGNSVTCCKWCNSMKGNHLSYEEMMIVAAALKAFREVISGDSSE